MMADQYRRGMSQMDVARTHGLSRQRVQMILHRLGVRSRPVGGEPVTRDDCVEYLMRRFHDMGRPPRLSEIRSDPDAPSPSTFERRLVEGRETLTEAIWRTTVEEIERMTT